MITLEQMFKRHANSLTKETLLTHIKNTVKYGRKHVENFDSINNKYVQKAVSGDYENLTKYQLCELKYYLYKAIDKARFGEDYPSVIAL